MLDVVHKVDEDTVGVFMKLPFVRMHWAVAVSCSPTIPHEVRQEDEHVQSEGDYAKGN